MTYKEVTLPRHLVVVVPIACNALSSIRAVCYDMEEGRIGLLNTVFPMEIIIFVENVFLLANVCYHLFKPHI